MRWLDLPVLLCVSLFALAGCQTSDAPAPTPEADGVTVAIRPVRLPPKDDTVLIVSPTYSRIHAERGLVAAWNVWLPASGAGVSKGLQQGTGFEVTYLASATGKRSSNTATEPFRIARVSPGRYMLGELTIGRHTTRPNRVGVTIALYPGHAYYMGDMELLKMGGNSALAIGEDRERMREAQRFLAVKLGREVPELRTLRLEAKPTR
jgi:hypothetical protein